MCLRWCGNVVGTEASLVHAVGCLHWGHRPGLTASSDGSLVTSAPDPGPGHSSSYCHPCSPTTNDIALTANTHQLTHVPLLSTSVISIHMYSDTSHVA